MKKVTVFSLIAAALLAFPCCSNASEEDDGESAGASVLATVTNDDGSTTARAGDGTAVTAKTNDDGSVALTITNAEGAKFEVTKAAGARPASDAATWASGFDASSVAPDEKRKDWNGTEKPFFQILSDNGVNTVRLRAWVEPYARNKDVNSDLGWSGGSDTATVVAQAVAAQNAGLSVMIDFHYSDCWADPGKQVIPASWQKTCTTQEQLAAKVREYTTEVLALLKAAGVTPAYVQVGNEINHGMLAHKARNGNTSVNADDTISGRRQNQNYAVMAKYVKAGCEAVRAFDPGIKIILHVARSSYNNDTIDALMSKGVTDFDIVGYSWYPGYSHGTLSALAKDIQAYVKKGKQVMVVETSVPASKGDMSMARAYENYKDNPTGKMYDDLTVSGNALTYSVANQKNGLVHTMEEVAKAGGCGVFTWGGEIPMGNWAMFGDGKAFESMAAFKYRP